MMKSNSKSEKFYFEMNKYKSNEYENKSKIMSNQKKKVIKLRNREKTERK